MHQIIPFHLSLWNILPWHNSSLWIKEEKVKDLARQLNDILGATRPVQDSLNLNLDTGKARCNTFITVWGIMFHTIRSTV